MSVPQPSRGIAGLAVPAWLRATGSLGAAWARELVEQQAVDRALALASKCFVAVVPLTILSSAVLSGRAFGDELVRRFGLSGAGADAAQLLFAAPTQVEASIGALGAVILVGSVLSFARALSRVYLDAWRLPPAGRADQVDRLIWLIGLFATLAIGVVVRSGGAVPVGRGVGWLLNAAVASAFFLWTPYILLGRRIPVRRLLPTAGITGAAALALAVGSAVTMPGLVSRNTDRYGLIGFAFSLVSWLFCAALLIVASAALGALLDRRRLAR